jgi:hypothetical protein
VMPRLPCFVYDARSLFGEAAKIVSASQPRFPQSRSGLLSNLGRLVALH